MSEEINTAKCFICGHENHTVTWLDAIKRENTGEVWRVSGEVNFIDEEEGFDLSDIISPEIDKLDDFDEETDELILMSHEINKFTREDIEKLNFGDEDWGGLCNHCKGYL